MAHAQLQGVVVLYIAANGPRAPDMYTSRRVWLATGAALAGAPALASANWLSSEPLERVRRLEQELADAKYGELAPIDDGTGGAKRLVPILQLRAALAALQDQAADPANWRALADRVQRDPALETKALKRMFNFYSDNIYFSDERRANVYLLGGTAPETAQTQQYLLRNEVITGIENIRLELAYLRDQAAKEGGDTDAGDLAGYFRTTLKGLDDYLALATPRDLKVAATLVS